MKLNLKNLYITIPILFGGVALILHGYLGYFSRYIADDFCTAFFAQRLGVWRASWFWYLTWSGRYSASILDSMIGLLGPHALPAIVPLTIVIWLAVLMAFFLIFLHELKNKFLVSLAVAITSVFVLFLLAPNIRQSLYWGQGMRSVIPPLIMGPTQVILLNHVRSREWTKIQLGLWAVLSFIWALIAGGFSETYSSLQVAALIFSLLVMLFVEKFRFSNTSLLLTSGLLGAVSAFVIIVLAPGNSERQAFYPPPPDLAGIVTISLKSFFTYGARLVDSPDKILAVLGLLSLAAAIGSQLKREFDSRLLIVIPSLTLGFAFICFPPSAYGISDTPPDRTLILPTYLFLLGLIALGIISGNLLGKNHNFIVSKLLPGLAIVSITISASINSIGLYRSSHEFIQYAATWDEIDAKLLKSKQDGETQVLIPMTPNWAMLNTPNNNPRFWVNLCMSKYYDLQILVITNPSPSTP